jgi:hypothetical protein
MTYHIMHTSFLELYILFDAILHSVNTNNMCAYVHDQQLGGDSWC